MYQTTLFPIAEFAIITPKSKIPKTLKTKTAVILEAAKTLNSYHQNKKGSVNRFDTLKATFVYLCKNIPEDCPEDSAKVIYNYVRDSLALRAN